MNFWTSSQPYGAFLFASLKTHSTARTQSCRYWATSNSLWRAQPADTKSQGFAKKTHTHTDTHTDTHTHPHTHTHAHTHTDKHRQTQTNTHTHPHTHTDKHTHTHIIQTPVVGHPFSWWSALYVCGHIINGHASIALRCTSWRGASLIVAAHHTHILAHTHTHTHTPHPQTQLIHTQLTHTYSSTHNLLHTNPSPSLFSFLLTPCRLCLSFVACWKKLTCGVIRSFIFFLQVLHLGCYLLNATR